MLGYLLNGITTNFAAVFHIDKKTKYISFSVVGSALVSIGLNFILIPIFGIFGASISLTSGYFIGMLLMK